jgi:HIV Tat-specific factor 1
LHRKLLEWDEEDGFGPMVQPEDNINMTNKNSRVVVLKHMFTLEELEKDATLLLDLKEDVREESSSLGDVTNVVLYDVSAQLFNDRCFSELVYTEREGWYYDCQIS